MYFNAVILIILDLVSTFNVVQGFELCPAGYSCDQSKSFTPQQCPIGTFSAVGASSCTPCQPGYYQTSPGKGYCDECPPGMLVLILAIN